VLTAPGSTSSQSAKRTLAPAPGVTPPPTDGASYRFLSDVIIARGLVEPAAMKAALQASLAGRSLTEILVDNGELSEEDLARTLAEHHRLDFVDLEVFAVDPRATALIAPDVARRFGAVPIALLESGTLVVALYDPNGSTAVLEFAGLTDRVIQPAVASRKQIGALIASLPKQGARPTPPPSAPPAPPGPRMTNTDAGAPEPYGRSVPADDIHVPASRGPDEHRPPAAPIASRHPMDDRAALDGRADALRERAEAAERERDEAVERLQAAQERVRAAEQRAGEAVERARAAEEQTRLAEARARTSEERARAAGERVDAAEARADGLSSAADAANETLTRLVRACELLEREAETRAPELDNLRAALDVERAQRAQLESQLRYPEPNEDFLALKVRIAELERQLAERPAAPEPAFAPPTAVPHQAHAQAPVPTPAPAPAPPTAPAAYVVSAPPPQAYATAPPAPAVEPQASAPAPPAPVVEAPVEEVVPQYGPTIDIVGEPGVPYVPALAPMPSHDEPSRKAPKSTSAKARGIRRLISAIKRSA